MPKNEPQPAGNLRKPLEWFSAEQVSLWRYAIRNAPAGLLKRLDREALVTWVVAADIHRQAAEALKAEGLVIHSRNGIEMPNPNVGILNKQAMIMLRASDALGFSPAARTRVQVVKEEKTEDDKWSELAAVV